VTRFFIILHAKLSQNLKFNKYSHDCIICCIIDIVFAPIATELWIKCIIS